MKYSACLTALLTASFGGCVMGSNYTPPASDLEVAWNQRDASLIKGSEAKLNIAWWKQFHDPQLNALIETAYSQNLGLRTSALRILESRAILGIAQGNMLDTPVAPAQPSPVAHK